MDTHRAHGESIPYDVGLRVFYCRGDACRWQAFIADRSGQRRQGFHALPKGCEKLTGAHREAPLRVVY